MKIIRTTLLTLALLIFIAPYSHAQTSERILSFDSYIRIQKDSSIIVDEQIVVSANGTDIRHGIYRDIPTTYRNALFFTIRKPIEILGVKKNGMDEPYHTEQQGNNTRIYVGDAKTLISPGEYIYSIQYKTQKQLGYFEKYDELYWNVTGNDWNFPIDSAAVRIVFPPGVLPNSINAVGYIGASGSKDTNVIQSAARATSAGTSIQLTSSRPLGSHEGLTVAVNWPKGYVDIPTQSQNIQSLFLDNFATVFSFLLFLTAAVGYYLFWSREGKDRHVPSVTVVQFNPPEGMTPAQVRFIDQMGTFDNQAVAANLIHMAVAGYITIHENKTYHFVKRTGKAPDDLPAEEKLIYMSMFPDTNPISTDNENMADFSKLKKVQLNIKNPLLKTVTGPMMNQLEEAVKNFAVEQDTPDQFTFKYSNHYRVRKLFTSVEEYFKEIGKRMIIANTKYVWYGIVILVLIAVVNVINTLFNNAPQALFFMFFGIFWNGVTSLFVAAAAGSLISGIKNKRRTELFSGIALSIFLIPFVGIGAFTLFSALGLFGMIAFIGTLFITVASFHALKRRTDDARLIQNHIDGFKLFLSKAQQRYIEKIQNDLPAKFSMYEKFLPYAIALNVEPQWSAQFKSTIEQMNRENINTTPNWYTGSHWVSTGGALTASSFASAFSSSIGSATVNPSSSSGSSGGGSSGGGGGGGGGGGW